MALSTTTHPTRIQSAIAQVTDWIEANRENTRRQRNYARTVNELSALTNNELSDIGINRGMINDVAYEAAYGLPRR